MSCARCRHVLQRSTRILALLPDVALAAEPEPSRCAPGARCRTATVRRRNSRIRCRRGACARRRNPARVPWHQMPATDAGLDAIPASVADVALAADAGTKPDAPWAPGDGATDTRAPGSLLGQWLLCGGGSTWALLVLPRPGKAGFAGGEGVDFASHVGALPLPRNPNTRRRNQVHAGNGDAQQGTRIRSPSAPRLMPPRKATMMEKRWSMLTPIINVCETSPGYTAISLGKWRRPCPRHEHLVEMKQAPATSRAVCSPNSRREKP